MVKKTFVALVVMCVCLVAHAQTSRYSVFKVKGNVCKKVSGTWMPLKEQVPLAAIDTLKIAAEAALEILEPKTKLIYKANASGTVTVRQFVVASKTQSEQALANLNKAFSERMKSGGNQSGGMAAMCAAYRDGVPGKKTFEDSICATIAYIANEMCQGTFVHIDTCLTLCKQGDAHTFVLALANNTDRPYCVNVVCLNKEEESCRLLLKPGYDNDEPFVVLDAHTKATLDSYELLNDDNTVYFMVAIEKPFDNEEVRMLLADWSLCDGENLLPNLKIIKQQ